LGQLVAILVHCSAQETHLPGETHARDTPAKMELQQYPIGQTQRSLLVPRNEARGLLAVDEVAEESSYRRPQ